MDTLTTAVVALDRRLCRDRQCGCEPRLGTMGRPERCHDCPLDDVDALWDAIAKAEAR
jgi:hypothetical protein